jgi:predicted ATPase
LFGREQELSQLSAWLAAKVGAIAVWGSPGVGKTRLVHALLQQRAHEPSLDMERRAFVDVGEARALDELIELVARAMGVVLRGTDTPEVALGQALARQGSLLLVLDRVDKLSAEVAALVSLWTRSAPQLQLLLITRARVTLRSASVLELAPLSLRSPGPGVPSAAAALFFERARAANPAFGAAFQALEPVAQAQIERLVSALDGLPLAIELAAARSDVLGLGEVSARLERSEHGDVPAELGGEAMRGAIAGSRELLDAAERGAFRSCAVFRQDFDAQAAHAVLAASGPGPAVPELLQSLRDKSLLALSPSADLEHPRLFMFTPLREFAWAELERSGERGRVRDRYARYYAQLASEHAQAGPSAKRARLERERENLLSALEHAMSERPDGVHDVESARKLSVALEPLMVGRRATGQFLAWLDVCARSRSSSPRLRLHPNASWQPKSGWCALACWLHSAAMHRPSAISKPCSRSPSRWASSRSRGSRCSIWR